MAEIFVYIFLFSCLMALVSLFTPKTVFFVKNPTKMKAVAVWGVIALVCIVFGGELLKKKEAAQKADASQQPMAAEAIVEQPVIVNYTLLPYSLQTIKDTSIATRKRAQIGIALHATDTPVTKENLAASCMAAAKYLAPQTGNQAISVLIFDQLGTNWGHTRLAECDYSPDNGGWSGSDNWTWKEVKAAARTTTAQEKKISSLWNSMRKDFQKNGDTDEVALKKAIAQKIGIKPEEVSLPFLFFEDVPSAAYATVPATGPAVLPTANAENGDAKEFNQRMMDIVIAYDDVMEKLSNIRPLHGIKAEKTNAKNYKGFFYSLTPNVALLFCMEHEKNKPFAVKAIGVEDGTEQTRALIVLNCMGLIAAVTPGWTGDERGAVAKKLGITTTFPAFGKTTTAEYKNMNFSFANNGKNGITLTIEPIVSKQKATPPAPSQPQKQRQQDSSQRSPDRFDVNSLLGGEVKP